MKLSLELQQPCIQQPPLRLPRRPQPEHGDATAVAQVGGSQRRARGREIPTRPGRPSNGSFSIATREVAAPPQVQGVRIARARRRAEELKDQLGIDHGH